MPLVNADDSVAIVANVRIVVNVAAVVGRVQVVLKGDAITAIQINGAGADIGAIGSIDANSSHSTSTVVLMNPTIVDRAIVTAIINGQSFSAIVVHLTVQYLLIRAGRL